MKKTRNTIIASIFYTPQEDKSICHVCGTNKATENFIGIPVCDKCSANLKKKA